MPEQTENLIKSCNSATERLVIIGLLGTGLRLGEFRRLKPVFFDFDNQILNYTNSHSTRPIPIDLRTATVFKHYFKKHKKIRLSAKQIRRIVARVSKRAFGKSITPYTLRHTYTFNCIYKDIGLRSIQERLGLNIDYLVKYIAFLWRLYEE